MESTISPGTVFARLTVLEPAGRKNEHATSRCRCECGNIVEHARNDKLLHGRTKSCGCLRAELTAQEILEGQLREQIRTEIRDELRASAKLLTLRKRELATLQAKLEAAERREAKKRAKERRVQKDGADFAFHISQWSAAVHSPIPPPADASITLLLDPAPTANPQSDESAFACGFISDYRESDGRNVLTILDMVSNKYKGGGLADETLRLIQKWSPSKFSYENNPGLDWFYDLLLLKANARGISLPRIDPFSPHNGKACKEKRIQRVQSLFDCDPSAIVFQNGAYCEKLFEQARRFRIGADKKGVENGLLDALSLLAGFR
jgi:hypothetical protein